MTKILYITKNKYKVESAKRYTKKLGIELIQKKLDIEEIQSDSIAKIAKHKAKKAFKFLKKPLIVSDSGWRIPALKGFPGPYMHYINNWFSSEDFLILMANKKDKSVILEHVICGISSKGIKIFKKEFVGKFVKNPKGKGLSSDQVISFKNNKHTLAECQNINQDSTDDTDLWKKIHQWSKNL
ncbi:MAG: non-canonical purine NTP pyrophosphatase [bacterium]|nr:non-canonical purine NTP pyrophosphatase [bacterium]